jgi:hypothetical protein
MAPRKPSTSKPTTTPVAVPTTPTTANNALSSLPASINVNYPDVQSLLPTDWFKPSSSKVPQTDDATTQQELKIAHEQGNSLDLLNANMDNAMKLAGVAVKATKVGKLVAEYLVGLEEIRAVGVKLRGAQAATANEEKQVSIIQERGNMLGVKLDGERIKTSIERNKNQLSQVDERGYQQLLPIKETEWKNKLALAQQKAQQATDGK